jgi:hypothetical protein
MSSDVLLVEGVDPTDSAPPVSLRIGGAVHDAAEPGAATVASGYQPTARRLAMIRITHPRPELGRQSALGVDFIDGFAEVEELHPERALALTQHGFTIESPIALNADADAFVDLNSLNLSELRDIADTEGVDYTTKTRKPELIDLISRTPVYPIDDANAEQIDPDAEQGGEPAAPDLSLDELRTVARVEGVDVAEDATEQDIRDALQAADTESD